MLQKCVTSYLVSKLSFKIPRDNSISIDFDFLKPQKNVLNVKYSVSATDMEQARLINGQRSCKE